MVHGLSIVRKENILVLNFSKSCILKILVTLTFDFYLYDSIFK
jgi:hypothetical protein